MPDVRTLRNYIDGQWVDAEASDWLDVTNPSTGQLLAKVPLSTAGEVGRAVAAANRAYADWSRTPVSARCDRMFKLVHLLRQRSETIARTITEEMGKSLPDARADVKRNIEAFAPGGGFVFATVHDIQPHVEPEHIMAMWETWKEYGKYS